jgi:hypothetical protein
MRIIHVSGRILSIVALAISISLAGPSTAQPNAKNETFPCNNKNSKEQTPIDPSSKHSVSLSWNASVSLSTPLADSEGYNLYRLNPDGSCTKINLYSLNSDGSYTKSNEGLVRGSVLEDRFVELGKTYRYAATAVKQQSESGFSNVVEVTIPPT